MTPNRVNRAHWPTKENSQKNMHCVCIFLAHGQICLKWPQMGPGVVFPTNPNLANILGRMDLEFEILYIFVCWGPQLSRVPSPQISKFPDFQVPIFPDDAAAGAAGP